MVLFSTRTCTAPTYATAAQDPTMMLLNTRMSAASKCAVSGRKKASGSAAEVEGALAAVSEKIALDLDVFAAALGLDGIGAEVFKITAPDQAMMAAYHVNAAAAGRAVLDNARSLKMVEAR